jgi:hypothetical protein
MTTVDDTKTTIFPQTPQTSQTPVGQSGTGGKETAAGGAELPVIDLGKEVELPKEVAAIGVTKTPTVVPIPRPVGKMGVKPAGANVTIGTGATVTLPLTEQEVLQGLKAHIMHSWRWLSEWCIRRLKQLRLFQTKE